MKRILVLIFVIISCSHSTKTSERKFIELSQIDKGISYNDFSSLLQLKLARYPLKYFDYVDTTYSRAVITKDKMATSDFMLTYQGLFVDYADLYFFNDQLIGYKIASDDSSGDLEKLFLETENAQPVLLSKAVSNVAKDNIEQKKYKELDFDQFAMSFYSDPAMSKNENDQHWVVCLNRKHLSNMIRGILEGEFRNLSLFRANSDWRVKENPTGIYKSDQEFYDSILINKK